MTTQQRLLVAFGFTHAPEDNQALGSWIEDNPTFEANITELLDNLVSVDTQLTAARSDSMATKVGEINVNYGGHVTHLLKEGSRILEQLAVLTSTYQYFDKYKRCAVDLNPKEPIIDPGSTFYVVSLY